jgi:hypothetical protein
MDAANEVTSGAWPPRLDAPSRLAVLCAIDQATTEFGEALALLAECGLGDCAGLPVGLIDRLLLRAHHAVLGSDLEVVVGCSVCGVLNALPLGPDDVPEYAPRSAWSAPGAGTREPTGGDLVGLPEDAEAAAEELERRCRIGPSAAPRDAEALDRVDQSLSGTVHAACTECGADVTMDLDVQHLVTAAVAEAVAGVDVEVHLIAARYGWSLASIEALPDPRRMRLAALAGSAG